MLDRKKLKKRAARNFKSGFMEMTLASLLFSLLSGSLFQMYLNYYYNTVFPFLDSISDFANYLPKLTTENLPYLILVIVLVYIFIGSPFKVGLSLFFIDTTKNDYSLKPLLFGIKKENYKNNLITMLIRDLKILLWGLLLIIPGIIKLFEYIFVPYLLAEFPDLKTDEALKMSSAITYNHKFEIFMFKLSFIGWYILGAFLFGFGVIFADAYYTAAEAELYLELKKIAVDNKIISLD